MKTVAIVEMWDDKTISVYVPEFDGFNLNGQGKSVDEAKRSLHECIDDYITMLKEQGNEVPGELKNFKFISVSTFAKYAGINPSLMRQYKQRIAFASEAQKAKIEEAIHRAAREMLAVQL